MFDFMVMEIIYKEDNRNNKFIIAKTDKIMKECGLYRCNDRDMVYEAKDAKRSLIYITKACGLLMGYPGIIAAIECWNVYDDNGIKVDMLTKYMGSVER